ncbi:hypothetical protein BDZ91DRAFT_716171 [Kalaharituber pfeilii]|nr:hypothetical protein BDZ91DRAFT_716171 [Kalaharituber pfeilii]
MRAVARRDLLQTDLVFLDHILRDFKEAGNQKALRGQIIFWTMGSFKYAQGKYTNARSVVGDFLWMMVTLATGYGLLTALGWVLVRWCRRSANSVRRKLNAGELGPSDRNALDGWGWRVLEVMGQFW